MFRLLRVGGRVTAQRSHRALCFSQSVHHTSSLHAREGSKEGSNEGSLYSELLADIQQSAIKLTENASNVRGKELSSGKGNLTHLPENVECTDTTEQTKKVKKRRSPAKPKETQPGEKEPKSPRRIDERVRKKNIKGQEEVENKSKRRAPRKHEPIPADLLNNPWDDVKRYITAGYGGSNRRGRPMGDNKRIHVISEQLCDDTLKRLDTSLEKHMGCDILDLNPGTCLWSSKLHDRLKPRTHILLEPDVQLYEPFIKPLLDAPDSTYKHIPESGIVWGDLEKVLSKEHLPFQEAYKPDDPRLHEPNNTLLVTASIGFYPKKPYRGFPSLGSLLLHQFASAMRTKSIFQRYGQVRVLVWVDNKERQKAIPKEIHMRRKGSIEFDICCDAREIASLSGYGYFRSRVFLDLLKAQEVLDKMTSNGVHIPKGRESELLTELQDQGGTFKQGSHLESFDRYTDEWTKLAADYANGVFEKYTDDADSPVRLTPKGKARRYYTKEYIRLRSLRMRHRWRENKDLDHQQRNAQYQFLMDFQKEVHTARQNGTVTEAQESEWREMIESWSEDLQEIHHGLQSSYIHSLDNLLAYNCDPPILAWDRRDTEPLEVHADEFFPKGGVMCLLDLKPRELWPILKTDPSSYEILDFIAGTMFVSSTQSVKKSLQSLWPGAYEHLVAECPSLTNPHKGGNLDLELLRVRCITLEMLEEIVEAWVKWPFKPTRYELVSRMGNEIASDNFHETDR